MKKDITSTSKISNSHQTVIKRAVPLIKQLKKSEHVNKIVIGYIKNTRSKVAKVLTDVNKTSVRMVVKSHGELQEFYLIGGDPKTINQQIQNIIT